ncbi:hypothetical protein PRZ48_007223 [Zasmidium cellare]|uniref:BZIP domain-containing protein n=1 Tax=Zasmidium cellare TaxID=395010 RepID=A0ABR0EIS3_ZASCE|nr:hypothetical protein PRZ48_007223 [Zasmidium cellare]
MAQENIAQENMAQENMSMAADFTMPMPMSDDSFGTIPFEQQPPFEQQATQAQQVFQQPPVDAHVNPAFAMATFRSHSMFEMGGHAQVHSFQGYDNVPRLFQEQFNVHDSTYPELANHPQQATYPQHPQQLTPGRPTVQDDQRNPSLGALQHHANQYANAYTHAQPAAFPPQTHRGSSDDRYAAVPTTRNDRVPIEREKRGSCQSSGSITPEESTAGSEPGMVVQQSGPMSSSVTVPSRPRPGRKPIPQEDAADRRRLQNRIAQRNFRDKRQQKLHETLTELDDNKREYQATLADMSRRVEDGRQAYRELETRFNAQSERIQAVLDRTESLERRNQDLERRNEELEKQLKAAQSQQQQLPSIANFRAAEPVITRNPLNQPNEATPPRSENDMEIDFTTFGRNAQAGFGLQQTTTNDSNQMDYQTADHCGFCTDAQNCACAQEKAAVAAAAAEKPVPVSLPGSCDQCRADPVRAQACRDMAASTQISTHPSTSVGTAAQASSSMPPPPRRTCASMVDSFNQFGERTSSIASLFGGGRLNTYPAPNGGGYEFEETEAAQVLSNLHRRSTKAESPRSVAESVAESAQEERSPRTL